VKLSILAVCHAKILTKLIRSVLIKLKCPEISMIQTVFEYNGLYFQGAAMIFLILSPQAELKKISKFYRGSEGCRICSLSN